MQLVESSIALLTIMIYATAAYAASEVPPLYPPPPPAPRPRRPRRPRPVSPGRQVPSVLRVAMDPEEAVVDLDAVLNLLRFSPYDDLHGPL